MNRENPYPIISLKMFYAVNAFMVLTVAFLTYLSRNYSMDDAFIYYRYIQNAIDGNGLVYNAGERFYGITSAFYLYISVFTAFFVRNVLLNQLLLSGIFYATAMLVMFRLCARDEKLGYLAVVPAVLMAGAKFLYMTFGMETPLYLMLAALALYFYEKKSYYALAITGAFLILTRGEAVLLLLTMLAFHFIYRKEKIDPKILIVPAIILIANFLYNFLYFGQLLPSTFAAKMQQGDSGLWRSFPFLRISHIIFWGDKVIFPYANGVFVSFFFAIAALGAVTHFHKSQIVGIITVFLILNTAFYLGLNIPGYPWYYGIYYFGAFIMFAYGLLTIFNYLKKVKPNAVKLRIAATGALPALFFVMLYYYSFSTLETTLVNQDYKYAGEWLDKNTPKNASVACVEIGHIGWYSKRYIIDILGLVNPYNAKFIGEKKFDEWLKYYSPDYIFTHYPVWNHEQSIPKIIENKTYIPVDDFRLKGFLMLKRNNNK